MDKDKTRQERREKKKRKKEDRIQQHGRGFVRAYKDAILNKLKKEES